LGVHFASVPGKPAQSRAPSPAEPVAAARQAHLQYVTDTLPGIRRIRRGRAFDYADERGRLIRKPGELERLRRLAIPPAWKEVWISPDPRGHLLAVGRDARGRKQYRYHPRWRHVRDETKFHRMAEFARALPRLRARVARDLARPGLPREKVLATLVRLLESTLIRVGNEEYARHNASFGLTTLRNRHVKVRGSKLRFEFRGKHGIVHSVDLHDRRLARIVKRCQDLPGQTLFQYLDEHGTRHGIGSADVNQYLRDISGEDFSAKDFRTWAGTVLALRELSDLRGRRRRSEREAKLDVKRAIERVALVLGNTPAICLKCYVHPRVIESYMQGALSRPSRKAATSRVRAHALKAEERAVLALLRREHASLAENA
jgi:DNA topoisomerase-1